MKKILRIVLSFAVVFAAVALGFLSITPQSFAWYDALLKPDFTPPGWVFAPIWLALYVLMAIALARVWNSDEDGKNKKRMWFFAFGTQLILNVLWSLLFFSFHGLTLSVVDLVVLWFAVVVLVLNSYELDRTSFWLLVPYLAWITFALILDVAIWWID